MLGQNRKGLFFLSAKDLNVKKMLSFILKRLSVRHLKRQ